MTKTYSTKATAKRALKTTLGKIDLTLDDVNFEILEDSDGTFWNKIEFLDIETPEGYEILEGVAHIVILQTKTEDPDPAEGMGFDETETLTEGDEEQITAEPMQEGDELPGSDDDEQPEAPAPSKSGYIRERSNHGGVVAEVHAIADSMPEARRKDVIEACRQRGIAYGTARTQYQKWKSKQK